MLECFQSRRKDLAAQVEALAGRAATDVVHREEIDARAWRLVRRLELYRPTGPLAFFEHPQQARGYLRRLREDFRGAVDSAEVELVEEITHALEILKGVSDRPLF